MSIFSTIPKPRVRHSAFDLTHTNTLTLDAGYLTPIMCKEILPGDVWRCSHEAFMRLMPTIAPILHEVDVYIHDFFVPNRIIWRDWKTFITGGPDGTEAPVMPCCSSKMLYDLGKSDKKYRPLLDYLGYPCNYDSDGNLILEADTKFNIIPILAYQKIYNDFYRDENLIEELPSTFEDWVDAGLIKLDSDGYILSISEDLVALRLRAWEKDYFSSALPWTQRGPAVDIANGASQKISGTGNVNFNFNSQSDYGFFGFDSSSNPVTVNGEMFDDKLERAIITSDTNNFVRGIIDSYGGAITGTVNGSDYTLSSLGITVEELRTNIRLQEWLENNARGGSRYVEQLFSHFGTVAPDYLMERPMYLGGNKQNVVVSEVSQTSSSTDSSPLGDYAGHGISVGQSKSWKHKFLEHGYIISLMSIRPRSAYFQGVSKQLTKLDKLDFAFPEFDHLGEQSVQNMELYFSSDSATNAKTFGYQPRYSEYKYSPNEIHGEMRTSLNYWHLGRYFDSLPALNKEFIEVQPSDVDRIFALQYQSEEDSRFVCEVLNHAKASRPLSYYGVPMIL